jgi:cytochrome c oxidase assembly protein subunit 11
MSDTVSPKQKTPQDMLAQKNRRVMTRVLFAVFFMVGLSFASVPLYDLFCRVTGFGGTTQVSDSLPDTIIQDRTFVIRFNTDVAPDLQWDFAALDNNIEVNPGQKGLIAYNVRNNMGAPVAGAAVFNVSPPRAGRYFHKVQCFCFEEQILQPGVDMNMPVMFYVDPEIVNDRQMDSVTSITLSYTFFKTDTEALDEALEDFYNQDNI